MWALGELCDAMTARQGEEESMLPRQMAFVMGAHPSGACQSPSPCPCPSVFPACRLSWLRPQPGDSVAPRRGPIRRLRDALRPCVNYRLGCLYSVLRSLGHFIAVVDSRRSSQVLLRCIRVHGHYSHRSRPRGCLAQGSDVATAIRLSADDFAIHLRNHIRHRMVFLG